MNQIQIWKNASEIYADIAELPVQNALAHVNELGDISQQLKQAVITLVHAGSQDSHYFDNNITPYFNPNSEPPQTYKAGQQLDEYELILELGQGGMSQVFKAKRTISEQQTDVAIKIFSPKHGPQELLKHFIREQKILSQLSHPHIVKMLHGGLTDDDVAYLVMELVEEAQPIDKYCQTHKVDNKTIVKFIHKCADALSYSHASLVIHRDLKPDNILINKHNELKIVDFGIAKLISQEITGNNTTILALTPNYAAPEQINAGRISVKTDIFSLAVVALDLLTQGRPLPKDRLLKSCVNDELHIEMTIKSSTANKDLKNILLKALQQNPENRYMTMNQFAQDLQAWLKNEPVTATGNSWYYHASKFAQRRKALFASLVTLLVTMVFSIFVLSWQYQQTILEKHRAVEIKDFMLNIFASVDPENNTKSDLPALDLLNFATEQIEHKNFSDLEVRSDILTNIGTSLVHLGSSEKGEKLLLQAIKSNPNNDLAQLNLIQLYINQTQLDDAQNLIDLLNKKFKHEDISLKMQLNLLQGYVFKFRGQYQQALILVNTSRDWFIESNDYLNILKSTTVLSHIYYQLEQGQKSINIIESTLKHVGQYVSPTFPALLRLQIRQAKLYGYLDKSDKAIQIINSTISNINQKLGNQHPLSIIAMSEKASILNEAKKFEQALLVANKSYEIAVNKDGEKSALAQNSLYIIANIQYSQGNYEKSLESFEKILKLSTDYYGRDNYITINVAIEMSNLYFLAGQQAKAFEYTKKLTQRILKTHGEDNELTVFANNVYIELFVKSNLLSKDVYQMSKNNYENALKFLNSKHPQTIFAKNIFDKTSLRTQ